MPFLAAKASHFRLGRVVEMIILCMDERDFLECSPGQGACQLCMTKECQTGPAVVRMDQKRPQVAESGAFGLTFLPKEGVTDG
jgi:hypothetical protein